MNECQLLVRLKSSTDQRTTGKKHNSPLFAYWIPRQHMNLLATQFSIFLCQHCLCYYLRIAYFSDTQSQITIQCKNIIMQLLTNNEYFRESFCIMKLWHCFSSICDSSSSLQAEMGLNPKTNFKNLSYFIPVSSLGVSFFFPYNCLTPFKILLCFRVNNFLWQNFPQQTRDYLITLGSTVKFHAQHNED